MKPTLCMFLLLAALLLSACGMVPPARDPLHGTSWQLSEMAGEPALPGPKVTLAFEDGQAGGNAGCNSYGGSYRVEGDAIRIEQVVSTMMACADGAVMEQESAYLRLLGSARSFEIAEGRLQLHGSGGEALAFVPAP